MTLKKKKNWLQPNAGNNSVPSSCSRFFARGLPSFTEFYRVFFWFHASSWYLVGRACPFREPVFRCFTRSSLTRRVRSNEFFFCFF